MSRDDLVDATGAALQEMGIEEKWMAKIREYLAPELVYHSILIERREAIDRLRAKLLREFGSWRYGKASDRQLDHALAEWSAMRSRAHDRAARSERAAS